MEKEIIEILERNTTEVDNFNNAVFESDFDDVAFDIKELIVQELENVLKMTIGTDFGDIIRPYDVQNRITELSRVVKPTNT